ncbi:FAD-dependent oxidoreductase [Microbacterium sp. NPDC090007]|uniref:FAD-dependent oxidoreductase n=1 Tax=Microbacterium sp. NPDC090007 TaxID=3364204 RepID=UPI0038009F73
MSGVKYVVIGGGILGLTSAMHLLKDDDVARVILVEKTAPLAGISGQAGAGDLPIFWSERHRDLIERSWSHHLGRSSSDGRTRHPVAWNGFDADESISVWGGTVPMSQAPSDLSAPLRRDVNPDVLPQITASWAYRISPLAHGASLLRDLRRDPRFTEIIGEAADTIPTRGGVLVRLDDGSDIQADGVIVAVGPWITAADNSWASAARALGLRTKRVFGLRAQVEPGRRGTSAFADAEQAIFILPTTRRDEIAMSIRHAEWDVDAGPGDLPREVRDKGVDAVRRLTTWGGLSDIRPRVHVDTYTPDSTPHVVAAGNQRVVLITATHGSGIRLAPALAEDAVALLRKASVVPETAGRAQ